MIASLALIALASQSQAFPQHLVRLDGGTDTARVAQRLGLDVVETNQDGSVLAIVDSTQITEATVHGLACAVVVEDLVEHYAARLRSSARESASSSSPYGAGWSPPFGAGGMGGFYTFDEIVGVLDQLHATYPELITQKTSIGTTYEGRDIWMVKISDQAAVDEDEPEALIDAMHHGREPESMQATLYFMGWLLEAYGSDPLATYLVDEREIYFVPCVNPDGYEYNRSIAPGGGGLWRKNRRPNFDGTFGVDLNRNYPVQWATVGSSSDPASLIYHGPFAASEPETRAMMAFLGTRELSTALTVHTYLDAWLAPLAYTAIYPAQWDELQEIGDAAIELNGYSHAPVPRLLSETGGSSLDYYFETEDIYTWAPEIGGQFDGFWPSTDQIVPLAEENRIAFARTSMAAGIWLRSEGLVVRDGGDADGVFEVGERVEVTASVRNSGRRDGIPTVLRLEVDGPYGTVLDGSSMVQPASFSTESNPTPLSFRIRPGTPDGTRIPVRVTVEQAGRPIVMFAEVEVGRRIIAAYDFDGPTDEGWGRGSPNTAQLGEWERADPITSASKPEVDHTPGPGGLCWITGPGWLGAGIAFNNVGAGTTSLLSPAIPFNGAAKGTLEFAFWFYTDDIERPDVEGLHVYLSDDDGATWVEAFVPDPLIPTARRGWRKGSIDLGSFVSLSGSVRVRFSATDLVGVTSIVDVAVDDVVFSAVGQSDCPLPTNYCDISPNGATAGSTIAAAGSQSLSANEFQLAMSAAPPNAFGVFFVGSQVTNSPLGNGRLCIGGPLTRVGLVQADPGGFGVRQVDFAALSTQVLPGMEWYFQAWHRDTFGASFNTTNGVSVIFCP